MYCLYIVSVPSKYKCVFFFFWFPFLPHKLLSLPRPCRVVQFFAKTACYKYVTTIMTTAESQSRLMTNIITTPSIYTYALFTYHNSHFSIIMCWTHVYTNTIYLVKVIKERQGQKTEIEKQAIS